ncbi:MAG: exonuclease SbcCD subunit D [Candidatus Aenigmarchaeota archaeon]|nr:exonuclease SbcCD subunit D [Candidatus Aenigmarchaeota archaeon]
MSFKFAHMSDCHLGSWSSHPDMKEFAIRAFETAIDKCISERVDFIIIAGDLLDTSLPGIDVLKRAVSKFRQCREAGIPVYMVAGSHDYSPTGKTMLSVFENAGLVIDVARYEENEGRITLGFTVDEKTGCRLAGIFGKKGSLEVESFRHLDVPEEQPGFRIFVFHCGIDEHQSMHGMSSVPVSLLPKNFDYYATGHIHVRRIYRTERGRVAFPGPLFPTSFDELENYDSGFYIVSSDGEIQDVPVKMFETFLIDRDMTGKTPGEAESMLMDELRPMPNTVLLLRLKGILNGRPSDIDFKAVAAKAESLGAICMKKNISKLSSEAMEEAAMENIANVDDLERKLVAKHAERMKLLGRDNIEQLILSLMNVLKEEKGEDETNATFEEKVKENAKKVLGI